MRILERTSKWLLCVYTEKSKIKNRSMSLPRILEVGGGARSGGHLSHSSASNFQASKIYVVLVFVIQIR